MVKLCDVVMEGGGVKGIGLVGALETLNNDGYAIRRVAGTSAGAVVGALVAAGVPISKLSDCFSRLDYKQFRDEGSLDQLGPLGKGLSLLLENGVYEGNHLREWLASELVATGVETFDDIALTEDWAQQLPPEQRFKLVVNVADVSRGRLVRLPWDYAAYGLEPGKQKIIDAVRASASIPFFYEPVRLGESLLVDGALLSNFPIDLFDSIGEWPTFGIKLSARPDANLDLNPTDNPIDLGRSLLETMLNAHDQMHLDDPCTLKRTIFVDTLQIKSTNFDITAEQKMQLYINGQKAGRRFLKTWNFETYKQTCQPVVTTPQPKV